MQMQHAFCAQNKRKQLQFKTTFVNISEKVQSLTIAVYNECKNSPRSLQIAYQSLFF
jgi:hypothetical protein